VITQRHENDVAQSEPMFGPEVITLDKDIDLLPEGRELERGEQSALLDK